MTTWHGRRAKERKPDQDVFGPRILCGRMVDGQYACPELIGWVGEIAHDVALPTGWTDADTPGTYHETHRRPRRMSTGSPFGGRREIQPLKTVPPPVMVLCRKRHANLIDGDTDPRLSSA